MSDKLNSHSGPESELFDHLEYAEKLIVGLRHIKVPDALIAAILVAGLRLLLRDTDSETRNQIMRITME